MTESKQSPANTAASGNSADMSDIATNAAQSDVAMGEPGEAVQGSDTIVDSWASSATAQPEKVRNTLDDEWDEMMHQDFDPKDKEWLEYARSTNFDKISAKQRISFMKDLKAAYDVGDVKRQLTLWYVQGSKYWDEDQQALFARQPTATSSSSGSAQPQHTDPASTSAAAKGASGHRENLLEEKQAEH